MRIPDSFKAAQAAAFQDKHIEHLSTDTHTGTLGGSVTTPGQDVLGSYPCNVQVVTDQLLAQEYGLMVGQDIQATAASLPIQKGEYLRYAGQIYRVVEAPRYDAYQKILAKKVL